jgi:hypothetical protein
VQGSCLVHPPTGLLPSTLNLEPKWSHGRHRKDKPLPPRRGSRVSPPRCGVRAARRARAAGARRAFGCLSDGPEPRHTLASAHQCRPPSRLLAPRCVTSSQASVQLEHLRRETAGLTQQLVEAQVRRPAHACGSTAECRVLRSNPGQTSRLERPLLGQASRGAQPGVGCAACPQCATMLAAA